MSTFGGKDIRTMFPDDQRTRSKYLPIHPNAPHPDNGRVLYMIGDDREFYETYLNIEDWQVVNFKILRPFHRRAFMLFERSYNDLMSYMDSASWVDRHFPDMLRRSPDREPYWVRNVARSIEDAPRYYNRAEQVYRAVILVVAPADQNDSTNMPKKSIKASPDRDDKIIAPNASTTHGRWALENKATTALDVETVAALDAAPAEARISLLNAGPGGPPRESVRETIGGELKEVLREYRTHNEKTRGPSSTSSRISYVLALLIAICAGLFYLCQTWDMRGLWY
jgi:hypothetical protein